MTTAEPARTQPNEVLRYVKTVAPYLRIDTLKRALDVVQAMVTGQSVNLSVLSGHLPGKSSVKARKRRAERAFRDEQLTGELFLSLTLPLLPPGRLLLTLDRTTWERGAAPLNLLVLEVVLHGDTLPPIWTALPHDGNFLGRTAPMRTLARSSTDVRRELVQRLLKALPARRWKDLVADREFIGGAWFAFLRQRRKRRIKRAIHIRKDAVVDGLRQGEWFSDLQVEDVCCLFNRAEIYGERMRVVATRSPAGDLVVIATDFPVWETLASYRQRWSIECTFGSLKTRGFDLERTGGSPWASTDITQAARLERLFGLVILAWVACQRIGVWLAGQRPIKVKGHGRKALSLVRYGAETLKGVLRWDSGRLGTLAAELIQPFPALGAARSSCPVLSEISIRSDNLISNKCQNFVNGLLLCSTVPCDLPSAPVVSHRTTGRSSSSPSWGICLFPSCFSS